MIVESSKMKIFLVVLVVTLLMSTAESRNLKRQRRCGANPTTSTVKPTTTTVKPTTTTVKPTTTTVKPTTTTVKPTTTTVKPTTTTVKPTTTTVKPTTTTVKPTTTCPEKTCDRSGDIIGELIDSGNSGNIYVNSTGMDFELDEKPIEELGDDFLYNTVERLGIDDGSGWFTHVIAPEIFIDFGADTYVTSMTLRGAVNHLDAVYPKEAKVTFWKENEDESEGEILMVYGPEDYDTRKDTVFEKPIEARFAKIKLSKSEYSKDVENEIFDYPEDTPRGFTGARVAIYGCLDSVKGSS